jgi:hypothetical protein
VGGPLLQALLQAAGFGLGECASVLFLGERQGVLVPEPFQFGLQDGRRLVGSGVLPCPARSLGVDCLAVGRVSVRWGGALSRNPAANRSSRR